ncbi:MAG: DinB family protein [Bryobacterales bacterium]|nr:DinB family protein [Bryobacterales bacterium]
MSELADLLERFRRGGELLAVVTTGAAGAELDWAPEPGKWSVRQIVCHLSDSEIVGADRLRRVIAEDNPTLIAYDQEAWAAKLDYHKRKFSHAIEMFRRMRAENYELLKDLPEETYRRTGKHSEDGEISLLELLRGYAGHAEAHAGQIQALRRQYKQMKAK